MNSHRPRMNDDFTSDEDPETENDLVLAPPRGRSPSERERIAKNYPPVTDEKVPTRQSTQFPMRSLFLLTLAVAIGMAGRNFVSAKIFAGVLAVIVNFLVFGVEWKLIEDPWVQAVTTWLCVVCGVAVVIALLG